MVHYKSDGVFDASVEKIWKYLTSEQDHQHKAFKSSRTTSTSGNVATVEAEVYNPDGRTTSRATFRHMLNPPEGFETAVTGGPMDGTRFKHTYTALGDRTRVEMEGDFKAVPGMSEAAQLKFLDDFWAQMFDEDNANLRKVK
jgi:hypothetical protein